MTVREVLSLAKYGELRTLAVKDSDEMVVGFLNMALIELYKRFPIETDETILTLQDNVDIYTLPSDCMYIIGAYQEIEETVGNARVEELPINDENNPYSINTVSWNKVQVPYSVSGGYISIIYVSSPQYIVYSEVDDSYLNTELALPTQMIEALLHYMGYRAHGATNGEINAENTTHYMRFEASCTRIKELGLFTADNSNAPEDKFYMRGFA